LPDGDSLNPRIFMAKGLGPRLEEPACQIVGIVGAVHDDPLNRIVAALWIVIARHQLTRSPFRGVACVLGVERLQSTGGVARHLPSDLQPRVCVRHADDEFGYN